MAVTAFSFTPKPIKEIVTYLGNATVDNKEYQVRVTKTKEHGIHKSTIIRLASYPPNMSFEEASFVEDKLAEFTENNDVW